MTTYFLATGYANTGVVNAAVCLHSPLPQALGELGTLEAEDSHRELHVRCLGPEAVASPQVKVFQSAMTD